MKGKFYHTQVEDNTMMTFVSMILCGKAMASPSRTPANGNHTFTT